MLNFLKGKPLDILTNKSPENIVNQSESHSLKTSDLDSESMKSKCSSEDNLSRDESTPEILSFEDQHRV